MEFVVLLIALICVVWTAIYAKHATLVTSSALVLIVGSCFGHAFFNTNVGPLPITLDRVLWCGLIAQFLYFNHVRLNDPKPIGRADVVFALYIAYLGINTLMTDWQQNSKAPLAHLLFIYVVPAAMYWVARQAKLGEREFRLFTLIMSVFGLYLAVTAFAETRGWSFLIYPKHISSTDVTEFLGRGRGPFLNPVSCGIFQIFSFCCMLMWWPRVGQRGKALLVACSIVFTIGIICTLTRSVWVSMMASVGLVIWLSVTRRSRGLLIVGAVAAGAIGLLISGQELGSFKRDKHVTETQMAKSAALRPMLAAVACDMAMDRPLFGCGLAQYTENAAPYHYSDDWNMPIRTVIVYVQHNMLLASIVETGLVGMLLMVTLLCTWTWLGWKLWRSMESPLWVRQFGILQMVLVLSFSINGMFHDTLIIPMGTTLVFFMAGITSGIASRYLYYSCASDGPVHFRTEEAVTPADPVVT